MLSTEKMQKVRILALHSHKYEIIQTLQKEGAIDIRKSKREAKDDAPLEDLPEVSELLIKFKSAEAILSEHLGKKKPVIEQRKQLEKERLVKEASSFKALPRIFELTDKKHELQEELNDINETIVVAKMFVGTDIDFSVLSSEVLRFTAFTVDRKGVEKIKRKLEAHKHFSYELIENRIKDKVLMFLAYDSTKANAVNEILRDFKISEIDLTNKLLEGRAEKLLETLSKRATKAKEDMIGVDGELAKIAARDFVNVAAIREMLEIEVDRASISLYFKRTESTFYVEGWVPVKKLEDLEHRIRKVTNGKYELEQIDSKGEIAPTLVNRPKFLRSFDYIMEFMSMPRSDEIDPTWIFIITFPLFYGLMISDVGYGLASLAFSYLLTRITGEDDLLYHVARIWMMTSFAAIIFGVLSNQYFGYQLNGSIGLSPFTKFDWFTDATTILLYTIFFGIVQVILGLLFGFINKWRHGEKKLAISRLTAIVAVIAGIFAAGSTFFGAFGPAYVLPSMGITLAAIIATAALSGIEATEVTNLLTHPLSYARILGFGLASVIIAMLVDKWFTPTLAHGPLFFVFTLVVFILLHFVNMILGIFEGIVQGARLNFVEFFSKFFTGGGVKFSPFAYKRRYTKE